jgi:RNA-directed DNA polymerase
MQTKMVEAYKKGNLTKLYELQYQAVMSFEFRSYSVRKVVTNDGKNTPGVDNILWNKPELKYKAISKLRSTFIKPKKYKPKLIKRIWIPKPNSDKQRPLGIPTMEDRAVQTLISLVLDPVCEELSDQYSYGFRKHKSVHDAVSRVRFITDKSYSPEWVLDVDIENCFDTLSHDFINEKVKPILFNIGRNFIKRWLKAGIVEKGAIIRPKAGTPQGSVISPILCNLCLNGVDSIVRPDNPKVNTKEYKALRGCWSVRYADDIVLFARTKTQIVNEYLLKLETFLKVRGLKISKQKSKIINLKEESLCYLGWTFKLVPRDLRHNKTGVNKFVLLTKPSVKGIKRIKSKIKQYFKLSAPMSFIIRQLNPIIRGWVNYYRISFESSKVFSKLSGYILMLFWKWTKRNHPRKNKTWIVRNYIFSTQTHSWLIGIKNSTGSTILLVNPRTIPTIKVTAVKTDKNPYYDKEYFENRHKVLIIKEFRRKIYINHKYKCAACGELLDFNEDVELHRIKPGKEGGTYTFKNTVPLHKTCHESVTFAKNQWFKHLNTKK